MRVPNLLATVDCTSKAYGREIRRIPLALSTLSPHDLVTVLAFASDESVSGIWYVGWSRDRWLRRPRIVSRAGVWTRGRGGEADESWDASQAVTDALRRSADCFSQLDGRTTKSPARLDVIWGGRLVAGGSPRRARGGIAQLLVDGARNHTRTSQSEEALGHVAAWLDGELLGGASCSACAAEARPELTLALGADEASDERDLHLVACEACGRKTLVLEETSRRGAGERVRRREVDTGAARGTIVRAMRACPARSDPRCACPGHVQARAVAS